MQMGACAWLEECVVVIMKYSIHGYNSVHSAFSFFCKLLCLDEF